MSEDGSTRQMPTLEKETPAASGDSTAEATVSEPQAEAGRGHRFWSVRRGPAVLVSLLLLAAIGVLLYDLASVRAGRSAMSWRRTLADELATTRLDNGVAIAGAAVAALLGLWLIVFAATPGKRRLLPMRQDSRQLRAGLERSAASLVLRDRAMTVSGVQSVRVEVGRRKVKARALAHFRELDEVRADLRSALQDGVRELGLARRLRLKVRVRRPSRKG